jgi:hypothetical protein
VEVTASTEITPSATPAHNASSDNEEPPPDYSEILLQSKQEADDTSSTRKRKGFFRRRESGKSSVQSMDLGGSERGEDDGPIAERHADWGIGDDAGMGLS